jgi:hypothetical protein
MSGHQVTGDPADQVPIEPSDRRCKHGSSPSSQLESLSAFTTPV